MHSLIRLPLAAITLSASIAFIPAAITNTDNTPVYNNRTTEVIKEVKAVTAVSEKYTSWQLEQEGISPELFLNAMKGYNNLCKRNLLNNTSLITIIDFSKPSTQKRLFVLDVTNGQVLYKTLVAHGRNSGQLFARSFSNAASSYESSLGFYITSNTYTGKNGYSLKLTGCEKGFNNNAAKRAIVVHGADYVSESFIGQNGFLGRSHGCPALPETVSKEIIDMIKNGSCLFIYSPSKKYLSRSAILKSW